MAWWMTEGPVRRGQGERQSNAHVQRTLSRYPDSLSTFQRSTNLSSFLYNTIHLMNS